MWCLYNHRLKVHFKGHPYKCMANRIEEEKKASLRAQIPQRSPIASRELGGEEGQRDETVTEG